MTPPTQPTTTTAGAGAATGFRWNSPIPYLFGGLALMLTLIACALIILVCSYKKPYSSSSSSSNSSGNDAGDEEKQYVPEFCVGMSPEMEPKVVIVMPGHVNPTYLAKPVPQIAD